MSNDSAGVNPVEQAVISLPEPDFWLDCGQKPCYYHETVMRLLAAQRERMDRLYEVVSRIVETDHSVNITRLHDYCFGVPGVSADAVDGGPAED